MKGDKPQTEQSQRLGVPYPLAHDQPFVSGRRLVREAQEEVGIDGEFGPRR